MISVDAYGAGVIRGNVYNHPTYKDGASIQTPPLVRCDHLIADTLLYNKYLLGTPNKDYVHLWEQYGLGTVSHKPFYFDL